MGQGSRMSGQEEREKEGEKETETVSIRAFSIRALDVKLRQFHCILFVETAARPAKVQGEEA